MEEAEDMTYLEDAFKNLFSKDALVVMAKGIGLKRLFSKFLEAYGRGICGRKLVIVLNANEEVWVESSLYSSGLQPHELPKIVNSDLSTSARSALYATGGVFLLTNWVAISDILHHRLEASSICGLLIWNAHRVSETSMEAFVIRKFKQANPAGFVKAFSDNLMHLNYQSLSLLLQTLHTPSLLLYPRFHISVQSTLQSAVAVEERKLQLSSLMGRVQGSIIVAMKSCLAEIKRTVPHLDLFSPTESSDASPFDIEAELFRHTSYQALSTASSASSSPSLWLTTTAADTIFQCSRDRIYKYTTTANADNTTSIRIDPRIEIPPKWQCLQEIRLATPSVSTLQPDLILVIVHDSKTATILTEYLNSAAGDITTNTSISTAALLNKLCFYVSQQASAIRKQHDVRNPAAIPATTTSRLSAEQAAILQLEAELQTESINACVDNNSKTESSNEPSRKRNRGTTTSTTTVLFMTHQQIKSIHALELNPQYIIVYDIAVEVIRMIEASAALDQYVPRKVYLLLYEDSIETHYYSTYLKTEKMKFEKLIEMKSHIVLPTSSISSTAVTPTITDTRLATVVSTVATVIVDAREFRSPLPNILDLQHVSVVPSTLTVGDYVLTPNICVERKNSSSGSTSGNDLTSSFNSGRLYTQCENMCRHYGIPIVLIEFDANKQFCLQGVNDIGADIKPHNIISKLTLLLLAFPKLRLLWSRSVYHTVEIFKLLKSNLPQPDLEAATSIGSSSNSNVDAVESDVQQQITDVLLSFPGITIHNVHNVMNATNSIASLVNMSLEQMIAMIGSVNGKKLHNFLNHKSN